MRKEPDIFTPSIGLVAKLASLVVHVEEGAEPGGHAFDLLAVRSLLSDRDVIEWLAACRRKGLVPLKRSAR